MATVLLGDLVGTEAALLHFNIEEPPNLSMADFKRNLNDLGNLVTLAQVVETEDPYFLGMRARANELKIRRVSYGSPFIVDAEILEAGRNVVVGLAVVGTLLAAYSKAFKTFQEGRKASAETAAIRGEERRKQIKFDRDQAELILVEAAESLEQRAADVVGLTFSNRNPVWSNNPGRVTQILRTLWRLAQKDSTSFRVED